MESASSSVYTSKPYRAAVDYRGRGWAPIPLKVRSKAPKLPKEHPFLSRTATDEEFARFDFRHNIGIVAGKVSGILVLDDDDGGETLHKNGWHVPPTPTVKTKRGYQYYFCCPGGGFPTFDIVPQHLEVRAEGAYVVAPPSVHPSGTVYEWLISPDEAELADPPAWLLKQASMRRGRMQAEDVGEVIANGSRNKVLFSLAGTLRRRGLDEVAIARALLAINEVKCETPLAEDEVRKIAHSAARYEAAEHIGDQTTAEAPTNGHDPQSADGVRTNGLASLRRGLTDLGNAERFVDDHGERVRYCAPWAKWLVYDGKHWRRDDTGEVERLMKATVRGIYTEAADEPNDDRRRELAKHAKNSEAKKRISDAIQLARSEPGVPILPDDLDADPWLLNVENGTVDLRSGELGKHRREDLLSKLAPVEYRPEAEAPIFQAFLERILPQKAVRGFLQRGVGYAATGVIREEVLPILHGPGANGKTTLTGVLMEALGDYAIQAAPDLLMLKKGAHPTELADLYGARFVVCMENEEGRRLAESLVKYITGRERIKARRMREDFWEFNPTHTVFLGTNHRPEVRGTDHAIWRRLKLIPFDVTIPEAEQDKTLPETLHSELPGILAWIVLGCIEYQRDGLGEPEQVMDATKVYRTDMDPLEAFIDEECVVRPEAWCKFANLYSAYTRWCEESNEYPIKKRRFADRLTERGYERDVGTDGVKIRRGIALRHDGDPDPSRITDPAPDTDPDPHGSAPDLGENGNSGGDELPNGNSQKTCKSGRTDDRITDHYRKGYINTSNSPSKGLYGKVGNDQSFGNSEGDSNPPYTQEGTKDSSGTFESSNLHTFADNGSLSVDEVVEILCRPRSGPRINHPLYLTGKTTLEILARSVLTAMNRDADAWESAAAVVEEAARAHHPIECECEECL